LFLVLVLVLILVLVLVLVLAVALIVVVTILVVVIIVVAFTKVAQVPILERISGEENLRHSSVLFCLNQMQHSGTFVQLKGVGLRALVGDVLAWSRGRHGRNR